MTSFNDVDLSFVAPPDPGSLWRKIPLVDFDFVELQGQDVAILELPVNVVKRSKQSDKFSACER